jgi:hypothetical protein
MKFVKNMFSYGRVKLSNPLNRRLHEFLCLTPAIILMILFCNVNIFLLLRELPEKIIHYRAKIGKIN